MATNTGLGAWVEGEGTRFRVWAPSAKRLEVVLACGSAVPLERAPDGTFEGFVAGARAGDRYRYRVDGGGPFPDPASRFQPEGVHGPSEIIDPCSYSWSDGDWHGIGLDNLIVYELHVGTFSPAGTYAGVEERLPSLVELGVTAIELMPLADFPGQRNWGYDGVSLFAPARCYGRPDELRRLVDAAHRHGLAVLLDVVYNHLGPDGNYLGAYTPHYFSRQPTEWGAGPNFDGPHSAMVREFFLANALHWFHEYHVDGLRLDATHVIVDKGPRHFLAELAARVRESVAGRQVLLIAEDHRNFAAMLQPPAVGGWGLDAIWADDFHDELRRYLTGDHEGQFRDYRGTLEDLATTLRQGWFYCGQFSAHRKRPRGSDPTSISPRQCVVYLQNHDQTGNRALGERLHHQVDLAVYRAVSALLLCLPETPLLFMGQEWAASTPFLFFTDHHAELGRRVREGRRHEFRHFAAFAAPAARERIPDPQELATFAASHLIWEERTREPHAATLRLYQALLQLRRGEPALRQADRDSFEVMALKEQTLVLFREANQAAAVLAIIHLRGAGTVDLQSSKRALGRRWQLVLCTEDERYACDPCPPRVELESSVPVVQFARPGAVILREASVEELATDEHR